MRAYLLIVAILAVAQMSEAQVEKYSASKVKAKLLSHIQHDLKLIDQAAEKCWELGEQEQDSAKASRYNLAAEILTSIINVRHIPLVRAVHENIRGVSFEQDLRGVVQVNLELKTQLDGRLKDLYQLGADSQDGKIFFDYVSAVTKMLRQSSHYIMDIVTEGRGNYREE